MTYLQVIVEDGSPPDHETYLSTLDLETAEVAIIGETEGTTDHSASKSRQQGKKLRIKPDPTSPDNS